MRRLITAAFAVLLSISGCGGVPGAAGTAPDGATRDAVASVRTTAPTEIDATADVTITKCLPGDYGTFNPQLRIVNNTNAAASYTVTVSINDPDGTRLTEADASPIAIAAGETATLLAFGTLADPPAEVTCTVVSATRVGL